ncbi:hypothetical protein NC653_038864 [Populus alba x Populus x berolinensis]|uniref:Uncharacterized protein n=1 Tax=Populus alba x Populus x berolinensis TaxID=444605 RepID=A0AAD6LI85_9ROSI|nr:hypothetical protein NC653_038864 [Populus alba x Populus x berolinensis]
MKCRIGRPPHPPPPPPSLHRHHHGPSTTHNNLNYPATTPNTPSNVASYDGHIIPKPPQPNPFLIQVVTPASSPSPLVTSSRTATNTPPTVLTLSSLNLSLIEQLCKITVQSLIKYQLPHHNLDSLHFTCLR